MANPMVRMEVGCDEVAVITISHPPVNALTNQMYDAVKQYYNEAMMRHDIKALVVIGDGGKFCGGFDINTFVEVQRSGDTSLLGNASIEVMANTLEDAKKPSVAAIEGLALGGGLEFALACHARIATPKALLGLPELSLGIIPGAGGTQRLPRLVGLSKAIEMMLSSKPITSEEAKKCGLVDSIVPPSELLSAARLWALDMAERRKPWISSLRRTDKLGSLSDARKILRAARERSKQTAKNLPNHQACLDVIEEGVIFGGYAGVLKEDKVFKVLVNSTTSKGLVHAFFAQRATSKVPGVTDVGLKPRQLRKVAVIGGGLMGSGIATALILSGFSVVLKEINADYLQQGLKRIADNLNGLVKKGSLTQAKMDGAISLVKGVLDYSDFKDVDIVIEAAVEKVNLKQSLFSDIEKATSPQCILATNTSTIDLHVVGAKTQSQDRIVGAHFFSPAHVMPLLEIVRTQKTSPQVVLDLMTLGKAIRKVPVVVGNCTGFAVNRTFFPYTQGAHLLMNLGIDLFRIDQAISDFGMPLGPFQLQDVTGYELSLAVAVEFADAFAGRTFNSPLVKLMMENGRFGKKNGKGYYSYEKGSKPRPDPNTIPIVDECRRRANVMPGGKPLSLTDQEIVEMVFFPVVNEACRVLDEGIVVKASDLDVASVVGMSFPSYRGGIIFWADTVGPKHIYSSLNMWSEAYGDFFKPSSYLEQRAKSGLPLSAPSSTGTSRSRL